MRDRWHLVGTVVGLIGSTILSGIFGSKKYYPGEFSNASDAINSLYTVQQIDDDGNIVNALIATNAHGSTVVLRSGIYTASAGQVQIRWSTTGEESTQ